MNIKQFFSTKKIKTQFDNPGQIKAELLRLEQSLNGLQVMKADMSIMQVFGSKRGVLISRQIEVINAQRHRLMTIGAPNQFEQKINGDAEAANQEHTALRAKIEKAQAISMEANKKWEYLAGRANEYESELKQENAKAESSRAALQSKLDKAILEMNLEEEVAVANQLQRIDANATQVSGKTTALGLKHEATQRAAINAKSEAERAENALKELLDGLAKISRLQAEIEWDRGVNNLLHVGINFIKLVNGTHFGDRSHAMGGMQLPIFQPSRVIGCWRLAPGDNIGGGAFMGLMDAACRPTEEELKILNEDPETFSVNTLD